MVYKERKKRGGGGRKKINHIHFVLLPPPYWSRIPSAQWLSSTAKSQQPAWWLGQSPSYRRWEFKLPSSRARNASRFLDVHPNIWIEHKR